MKKQKLFVYESKHEPIHPSANYIQRIFKHLFAAFLLIFVSLVIGIFGYVYFESYSFLDSLLNASMILGGMGQVNLIKTEGGKIFASFYSLYSGFIVLISAGIVIAPIAHRILHRFHLEKSKDL